MYFAESVGLAPNIAAAAASTHVNDSPVWRNWSGFYLTNCSECSQDPATCKFLHPGEEECPAGATPEQVSMAISVAIERGDKSRCPRITKVDPPSGEPTGG